MKKLVLILISISFLFSFDFKKEFLARNYKEVCKNGMKEYFKGRKDENFLSLVGLSCAKSDSFNFLLYLIKDLKNTKDGRNNAIYFANLILQKKLLYAYMFDNIDISYFKTANTDNILSFVIEAISSKKFTKMGKVIIIRNKNFIYKVYRLEDKVFIDKYDENDNLIERHWYK
jgi:hypothetical protein